MYVLLMASEIEQLRKRFILLWRVAEERRRQGDVPLAPQPPPHPQWSQQKLGRFEGRNQILLPNLWCGWRGTRIWVVSRAINRELDGGSSKTRTSIYIGCWCRNQKIGMLHQGDGSRIFFHIFIGQLAICELGV